MFGLHFSHIKGALQGKSADFSEFSKRSSSQSKRQNEKERTRQYREYEIQNRIVAPESHVKANPPRLPSRLAFCLGNLSSPIETDRQHPT